MPGNAWGIINSVPVTLAPDFEFPTAEKAWEWFGLPMGGEGFAFDTLIIPWLEHDWFAILGYGMSGTSTADLGPPNLGTGIYQQITAGFAS